MVKFVRKFITRVFYMIIRPNDFLKTAFFAAFFIFLTPIYANQNPNIDKGDQQMKSIYDISVKDKEGKDVSLSEYKGKVLLIVNTATGCGFTPQYDGLEALYKKYKAQGFEILDFPCNQFLGQAPGSNEEIASFCKLKFGTDFKTFGKIEVNGEGASDLYKYLRSTSPAETKSEAASELYERLDKKHNFRTDGTEIKWNFTKFLVDKNGKIIARYAPTAKPQELEKAIEQLLQK